MSLTNLYSCSKCKKEFDFKNIKYDADRSLICLQCLEKKQRLERKELNSAKSEVQEGDEDQKSVKFICVSCRFKFEIKKGSQKAKKCPYCSKTKLMMVKRYKDEDDLIKDATDPRFNY